MNFPDIKHRASRSAPYADVYTSTVENLVLAGLITHEQLPGKPNMPKTRVSYLPDGSRATNGGRTNYWIEGYKVVRKVGPTNFSVEITPGRGVINQRASERQKNSKNGREAAQRTDNAAAEKVQIAVDVVQKRIRENRSELALSDSQLAELQRTKLRDSIARNEEFLREQLTILQDLGRSKKPVAKQPHLTLAWSASK